MNNELIAEKIMGWEKGNNCWHRRSEGKYRLYKLPNFIYDMNAAMMVVDKMRKQFHFEVDESPTREYHVEFYPVNSAGEFNYKATNYSLPTAICAAALETLSGDL